MCGTCGCKSAESFEATEWVGFCPECNKWRTKDMSVKIDSKINTTGWSIPDKLLGKRLCKKSQRFGNIRQSGDTFTGYGSRPFDDSYCGTPLTKVKSKYKTEGFEAETKLSKTSCCCGADEANPCACMKAPEPMECSAKAPKCACYKALEKNAEFLYYYVLNEKGESPADFNTLEEAQTYVANSSEPLEIYERRSRDDEAYKMDKKNDRFIYRKKNKQSIKFFKCY